MTKKTTTKGAFEPIFGGFVPHNFLWECKTSPPFFQSEWSARYFMRTYRSELVDAKAIARVGGRVLVHPERIERVILAVALRNVGGTAEMAIG